jgi:hypothetical protein
MICATPTDYGVVATADCFLIYSGLLYNDVIQNENVPLGHLEINHVHLDIKRDIVDILDH